RFELLGLVPHERGPRIGARDQPLERSEHLATVAHAEGEGVAPAEEPLELFARARVPQDGERPAAACTEHVAVREAAAGDEPLEAVERDTTLEQIRHVDVHGGEAYAREGRGHLDLP